jgi:hypothetical protein
MKLIWEPKDIKAGLRYSREGIEEVWTIGYLSYAETDVKYVSVSDQDGRVTAPSTVKHLAAKLTEGEYVPVELLATGYFNGPELPL